MKELEIARLQASPRLRSSGSLRKLGNLKARGGLAIVPLRVLSGHTEDAAAAGFGCVLNADSGVIGATASDIEETSKRITGMAGRLRLPGLLPASRGWKAGPRGCGKYQGLARWSPTLLRANPGAMSVWALTVRAPHPVCEGQRVDAQAKALSAHLGLDLTTLLGPFEGLENLGGFRV